MKPLPSRNCGSCTYLPRVYTSFTYITDYYYCCCCLLVGFVQSPSLLRESIPSAPPPKYEHPPPYGVCWSAVRNGPDNVAIHGLPDASVAASARQQSSSSNYFFSPIILSCVVFWFCGFVFGAIAFMLTSTYIIWYRNHYKVYVNSLKYPYFFIHGFHKKEPPIFNYNSRIFGIFFVIFVPLATGMNTLTSRHK